MDFYNYPSFGVKKITKRRRRSRSTKKRSSRSKSSRGKRVSFKTKSGKRVSFTVSGKKKSKRRVSKRTSSALAKWRSAAKKAGYLQPGGKFKKLPKKGTSGYKKIKSYYNKM